MLLIITGATLTSFAFAVNWLSVWSGLSASTERVLSVVALFVGLGLLTSAAFLPTQTGEDADAASFPRTHVMPVWIVALGILAAAAGVAITTMLLLTEADKATGVERAKLRVEAIRTGLTVGAGMGGLAALILAARHQWLEEQTQVHTEADARENRVTELYSNAVEQLGSTSVPTRFGGVYALERLADLEPSHRQAIVDVLCAYIRTTERRGEDAEIQQTALTLLGMHLRGQATSPDGKCRDGDRHWHGNSLNLADARVGYLDFERAHVGRMNFDRAVIEDDALFTNAVIYGGANFRQAKFERYVEFSGTRFHGAANFMVAILDGFVDFQDAVFQGAILFYETDFAPKQPSAAPRSSLMRISTDPNLERGPTLLGPHFVARLDSTSPRAPWI